MSGRMIEKMKRASSDAMQDGSFCEVKMYRQASLSACCLVVGLSGPVGLVF